MNIALSSDLVGLKVRVYFNHVLHGMRGVVKGCDSHGFMIEVYSKEYAGENQKKTINFIPHGSIRHLEVEED